MKPDDILFLGLKHSVTAISRVDGRVLWCTQLSGGGFGSSSKFVTLACDDSRVFAYSGGHLHCLDPASGRLLWSNELSGYGYGLASLCVPGHGAAPDTATIEHLIEQEEDAVDTSSNVSSS